MRRGKLGVLVKTSSVDSNHDPGVWEQNIRLLKSSYVFVSTEHISFEF